MTLRRKVRFSLRRNTIEPPDENYLMAKEEENRKAQLFLLIDFCFLLDLWLSERQL
jgi:hypothetical protein